MKRVTVGILAVLLMCSATDIYAGFGGSRSGGSSFSSGARSSGGSFGGSRSYSSGISRPSSPSTSARSLSFGGSRSSQSGPATITRPQAAPAQPSYNYSPPIVHETVIHHNSGGGFWSGMFMGSLLGNHSAPVIVNPGVMQGGSVMEPVYVQQGHSFFFYVFWIFVISILVFVAWRLLREDV